jgi:iron complex outermembrane receptor protein
VASTALCAIQTFTPAHADSTPADDSAGSDGGEGLAEVTVTAEKHETDLQKTPISMSVLQGADLDNRHVISLASLTDGSVPSLNVAPFFGRNSALDIGIRGIGMMADANQPSRDQGVGVYVDGVYLGRAQGLATALYDVQRIEVLKGPQGTLFGRNTEGGAISILTAKPTGGFSMDTRVGVSNFDGEEAATHINLPAFANVSIKLDGIIDRRGGTVTNPLAGQHDFDAYDKRGIHAEEIWQPTANFSVDYSYDFSYDASTPYYVQIVAGGTLKRAPLIALQPDRADTADFGVPLQYSVGKTSGHRVNLDWKLNDALDLKSITSYRQLTQGQYDNGEATLSVFVPSGNFARYSLADFRQHQYSQELQLVGNLPQVTFVTGAYYYHEYVHDDAWSPNTEQFNSTGTSYTVLPIPLGQTPFPDRASIAATTSEAVFGQATWTPPVAEDALHLTVGGRYNHDKKTGSLYLVNGAVPVVNGVTGALPLDASWSRFDPMVVVAFDLTRETSLYAKYDTGYKAGGANSRSLTYRSFDPESVVAYEIGAKSEFLDRHARFNIAAYSEEYKDVQIDFNALLPGVNRTTIETTNADGAGRSKGIEAELAFTPVSGLTWNVSYAHNNITLPMAPNPFAANTPLVKVNPIYAPHNMASTSLDYGFPLGGMQLKAHLDANYTSRQYTGASDPTLTDSAVVVNGHLALGDIHLSSGTLEFSLWSRNLLDEAHTFVRSFNSSLGTYAIFNEPRTFGLDIQLKL